MTRPIKTLLGLVLLIFTQSVCAEPPTGGYSFGIGPSQSAIELAKRWMPVMQYLSEKSGVPLQFKTGKDIPSFQQSVSDGAFDFVYINPYNYLLYHKGSGYTAFAREKDGKLNGVLVVKKDGPIKDIAQLNGQIVAFPSATALAATWMPLGMFQDEGIKVSPQYVNSMDSVYRTVAKGLFPAGGGELRTLGTIDPEVRSQLSILWTSDPLPPFAFAVHPRVSKEALGKVQKAMLKMEHDPQGLALLKAINFKGLEMTSDADYNAMRKLNIRPVESK